MTEEIISEQQIPKIVVTNTKKKTKITTLRLDDDILEMISEYIEKRGIRGKSQAIRELIEAGYNANRTQ